MPKIFSDAAIQYFGEVYSASNARNIGTAGGCMIAAYEGISALFGKDYALKGDVSIDFRQTTSHNEYDDLLEHLESSITEKEGTFKPTQGSKWKTSGNRIIESFEKHLIDSANSLPGNSQFYGVAVDGASHSIIVRVDKVTDSVYWMDQYTKGYSNMHENGFVKRPNVTGKFDKEIREMGNGVTRVWRFIPESLDNIEIPVDTNGDGKYDSTVPAVVEVEDSSNVSQEIIQPSHGETGFDDTSEGLSSQSSSNTLVGNDRVINSTMINPISTDLINHSESHEHDVFEVDEFDSDQMYDDSEQEYEICEPADDELNSDSDSDENSCQDGSENESDSHHEAPPPEPEPVAEVEPVAAP